MLNNNTITTRYPDLLATTGDYLRLWKVEEEVGGKAEVPMQTVLNNNKSSEFCAPLTSFDWCTENPRCVPRACRERARSVPEACQERAKCDCHTS